MRAFTILTKVQKHLERDRINGEDKIFTSRRICARAPDQTRVTTTLRKICRQIYFKAFEIWIHRTDPHRATTKRLQEMSTAKNSILYLIAQKIPY
jgi:hypothetical protein